MAPKIYIHFMKSVLVSLSIGLLSANAFGQTPIQEVFEPARPTNNAQYGMVAAVQWNGKYSPPVGPHVTIAQAEKYKQSNRADLSKYIRTAAAHGAKLIVTPEFGIVNYPNNMAGEFQNREEVAPYVEVYNGVSTQYFSRLARELKVYIQIGFVEVDPKTNIYYNAAVVVDPDGNIAAAYRKMNLFKGEDRFLSPGTQPTTYQNRFFGTVAIEICADIYYKELWPIYRDHVDAVTLSASWAKMDSGMVDFKTGAKQMHTFVIASNNMYYPDAGVVNPDGSTQSWIRQSSGIAYGYLPLKPLKPLK